MQPGSAAHSGRYYPELDGVRAIAAIMVILFHLNQMGLPLRGPSVFGETGVDLFFVLSGFLITGILLRARPRDWGEVQNFYLRRSLRIFPLYYAYLAGAVLLGTAVSHWYWIYLQNVVIALGAPMGGIGHFWSLAVEEQFYLVWPFVVLFLPRGKLQPVLWSMLLVTLLSRLVLVETTHVQVYYLTLTRMDGLAAGALLAMYQQRDMLRDKRRILQALASISLLLMAWQGLQYHGAGLPLVQVTKYTLIAAFYGSLVGLLLISEKPNPIRWVLRWRPLRFIGSISYGLYVFHPQILRYSLTHLRHHSPWTQGAVGLSATLAVTLLSWYCLEKPFLRLKSWLPQPATRSQPVAVASKARTWPWG